MKASMQCALMWLIAACVAAGSFPAYAKVRKHAADAAIEKSVAEMHPGSPAYRFPNYQEGGVTTSPLVWGYRFNTSTVISPAFTYYAPGYQSGPPYGAAAAGRYYASPCYVERQQVWDGVRLSVTRVRICR